MPFLICLPLVSCTALPLYCVLRHCFIETQFFQMSTRDGHTYHWVFVKDKECPAHAEWSTVSAVVVGTHCSGYTDFLLQKIINVFHVHTSAEVISVMPLNSDGDLKNLCLYQDGGPPSRCHVILMYWDLCTW